jgi:hypothetical protein
MKNQMELKSEIKKGEIKIKSLTKRKNGLGYEKVEFTSWCPHSELEI